MLDDSKLELEQCLKRAEELKKIGFDHGFGIASLEERIREMPSTWGNYWYVLIYGDFEKLEAPIHIPHLGLFIHPEHIENSNIKTAMTVLKAKVNIQDKTVSGLQDAARRINIFLGAAMLIGWGNSGCGWWSWVTHTNAGMYLKLDHPDISKAVDGILALPPNVRQKVGAALFWIREPTGLFLDFKNSELKVFSGYWNAFECLVDAVNIIKPDLPPTRAEKQQIIDKLLEQHNGVVSREFVQQAYLEVVNPGFAKKASHALRVCFVEKAEHYIFECFKKLPKKDRLYDIRNAINHGDIDAENALETLRVEKRLSKLKVMVLGMFGRLVPFSAPSENLPQ